MDTFSKYAQIKDIRTIKDKQGDQYRDFAFIEFHSIEDATYVIERAKQDRVKIRGQPVYLAFSKFKQSEQYVRNLTSIINFVVRELFRLIAGILWSFIVVPYSIS